MTGTEEDRPSPYQAFLSWAQNSHDSINVRRVYIDLAGDLVAGVILSQILYWNLPDRLGRPRLRVQKNGRMWLVKRRQDWWEECRASPKQFDRAIANLKARGIVTVGKWKFRGSPTTFIGLNWDVLLNLIQDQEK
jgi:hypothetical protein